MKDAIFNGHVDLITVVSCVPGVRQTAEYHVCFAVFDILLIHNQCFEHFPNCRLLMIGRYGGGLVFLNMVLETNYLRLLFR